MIRLLVNLTKAKQLGLFGQQGAASGTSGRAAPSKELTTVQVRAHTRQTAHA